MKKYLFFISIFTIVVWHKILYQVPLGEGYYYFDPGQNFIANGTIQNWWHYDLFARLLFDVITPILGQHLFLYMLFQMTVMILLNITIFWLLQKITNNKLLAFIATFLFLISFVGGFEMWSIANYQRFVQRVPNLFPMLISFALLHSYMKNKKIVHLILSFALYTLSVVMAHYSVFFMSPFILHPIIYSLFSQRKIKSVLQSIGVAGFFAVVTHLIIRGDFHNPPTGIFEFLRTSPLAAQQIVLQFGIISIPHILIETVSKGLSVGYPFTKILLPASLISVITFILLGVALITKKDKYRDFYLTSLLSIFPILFFNTYVGKVDAMRNFGHDRYYFLPVMLLSVCIAILLVNYIKNRYAIGFILGILLIYNSTLCWKLADDIQYKSVVMSRFIEEVKKISPQVDTETTIAIPSELLWPKCYLEEFFIPRHTNFVAYQGGWENQIINSEKVFAYVYDYKKLPGGVIPTTQGQLVDYSDYFKIHKVVPWEKYQ